MLADSPGFGRQEWLQVHCVALDAHHCEGSDKCQCAAWGPKKACRAAVKRTRVPWRHPAGDMVFGAAWCQDVFTTWCSCACICYGRLPRSAEQCICIWARTFASFSFGRVHKHSRFYGAMLGGVSRRGYDHDRCDVECCGSAAVVTIAKWMKGLCQLQRRYLAISCQYTWP
jgi:hypothetical protein